MSAELFRLNNLSRGRAETSTAAAGPPRAPQGPCCPSPALLTSLSFQSLTVFRALNSSWLACFGHCGQQRPWWLCPAWCPWLVYSQVVDFWAGVWQRRCQDANTLGRHAPGRGAGSFQSTSSNYRGCRTPPHSQRAANPNSLQCEPKREADNVTVFQHICCQRMNAPLLQ